jgi:phage terminase large subunit
MPLEKRWPFAQPKTYYDLKRSWDKRLIINQGGTRSGKTYSTLQVLVELCMKNKNKGLVISVVRKTLPSLKATAYRDFLDILMKEELYSEAHHNKSEMTYDLYGNMIEFFSVDEPQKVRGRKRDICFVNEANELTYEEFFQLNIRTTFKFIIDFNPSDEFLWIYDLPDTRRSLNDTSLFVTNYTHNPHLGEDLITEIELLEQADPDYWNVYGKGMRGASRELIFTHWKEIEEMPEQGDTFYGQDFGFNVASATIKVQLWENAIYCDELIYAPRLITADIADRYNELGIGYHDPIYCDAQAADSIEELERLGFNALKGQKDVKEGINKVKSMPLYVTSRSANLIKELRNYKWKKDPKTGLVLDEPVKFNDHGCDALRYAVFTHQSRPKRSRSFSA